MTLDPIAKPIAAVLAFFYSLIPNYAVSIVLLTVCVMIILTPLTIKQTRSMLVMQKLQPELKKLQEQHKNDRQALNEAVMGLYKEHNASPLGGCLPMLLPFPVFLALFRVLEGLSRMKKLPGATVATSNPKYLKSTTQMYLDIKHAGGHLDSFGVDLAKSALNINGNFIHKLPYFVLLLVMVGTQYYQQRQMTSRNPAAAQGPQANIMKFIPLFFGVISIRFPAGVVVYWTVSNGIRIFQQWAMYQFDPKVKALVTKDIKEVEARTREIDEHGSKPSKPRLRDLLSGAAIADTNKTVQPKAPPKGPAKTPPRPPRSAKPPGGAAKTPPPKAAASPKPPATAKPPRSRPPIAKAPPAKANGTTNGKSPRPIEKKPPAPVDDTAAKTNGANQDEGSDAPPKTPTDGTNGANGTPTRGRTGGSGARPGNRAKRDRRGR